MNKTSTPFNSNSHIIKAGSPHLRPVVESVPGIEIEVPKEVLKMLMSKLEILRLERMN